MLQLVKVESVSEVRTFVNGNGEQATAIDLELSQGNERFVCSAFDKTVTAIQNLKIVAGVLVWADLHFAVSGKDKRFQSVRVQSINLF